MRIGYIRASKKDRNPELQSRDLLAAGREKIFEEQILSCKADRPELRAALQYVRGLTPEAGVRPILSPHDAGISACRAVVRSI